jgi:DNA polymerase-3 subunit gamma/tau
LGLENILAIMQILDQTIARLRYSTHGRILAELALVRICQLENLERLSELIGQLRDGTATSQPAPRQPLPGLAGRPASQQLSPPQPVASQLAADAAAKKKPPVGDELSTSPAPASAEAPPAAARPPANLVHVWSEVLGGLSGMLADHARVATVTATSAPNRLAVCFPATYNFSKAFCERPENLMRLEKALSEAAGGTIRLEFSVSESAAAPEAKEPVAVRRQVSSGERLQEKSDHPMVRKAMELFAARPVRVEEAEARTQS